MRGYNQLMVEKIETFAERFERLRGNTSYEALATGIELKTKVRISPQALHKWVKGGGVAVENIRAVANYFGVSPGWLLFGEGAGPDATEHLESALQDLPQESQQQVLDFITYKIERAEGLLANDKLARHMALIESFKRDLAGLKS